MILNFFFATKFHSEKADWGSVSLTESTQQQLHTIGFHINLIHYILYCTVYVFIVTFVKPLQPNLIPWQFVDSHFCGFNVQSYRQPSMLPVHITTDIIKDGRCHGWRYEPSGIQNSNNNSCLFQYSNSCFNGFVMDFISLGPSDVTRLFLISVDIT